MGYSVTSPELYRSSAIEILVDSFLVTACHFFHGHIFLWTFFIFHLLGKQPFSRHFCKWLGEAIYYRFAHILSLRMLMSCPCVSFESKFCITFSISFAVNVVFDKDLSVLGCRKEEISLPLSMIERCLAKKELNNLGFSLKFVTNLFSWKIDGIQGIFSLLWKGFFSTDQYV